jgi:hypothetical protein
MSNDPSTETVVNNETAASEPVNGAPVNGTNGANGTAAHETLTPPRLAHQLFELALTQYKGNAGEASMQVIRFLTESLVFTISVSAADNELSRLNLLKHVAEKLMSAPLHPLVAKTVTKP